MRVLQDIQPKRVMYYFEEIAGIPHGSRNTKAISDYLVSFAEKHGLPHTQDELGNVVIRKSASSGCEKARGVILQGHMDMVCEKEADCAVDMEREGLRLILQKRSEIPEMMRMQELLLQQNRDISSEDIIVSAEGTTLGGDDGIAVAYMLAILESDTIVHPALECVFTVDEEIGMLGAAGMDMSQLTGKYLINIDSEDEGHLLTGCAGGCLTTITLPVKREAGIIGAVPVIIHVEGLQGGHSGIEIHKGRANADILLGRLLQDIESEFGLWKKKDRERGIYLTFTEGGTKDNAIPRFAKAGLLLTNETPVTELEEFLRREEAVFQREYGDRDPNLRLRLETKTQEHFPPLDPASEQKVIRLLRTVPNGIQKMSFETPGLVETSLNLGILRMTDKEMILSFCVRSNLDSERRELMDRLEAVAGVFEASCFHQGVYPAWEYSETSVLRAVMCECYKEQYGRDMIVETMHAGVECGYFVNGIYGLDAVSFGPDMKDIHTPKESMDTASAERTWRLLLSVLKRLAAEDAPA